MGATALVSGGKDSIYSAYLADTQGWDVDELLVLRPDDPDSMLFHTPTLDLVRLQASAWGKRYREVRIAGDGEDAETAALAGALATAGDPVIAGAIASSYQWGRLHRLTYALGRRLWTPLWGKAPDVVVRAEISAGLDIRLVQLAAEPLGPELLGRRLDLGLLAELERLGRERRSVNVAGEGGEYETAVVDAPFFRRRVRLGGGTTETTGGLHRLLVPDASLEAKAGPEERTD
jgi:diphthine-ammonia ligase